MASTNFSSVLKTIAIGLVFNLLFGLLVTASPVTKEDVFSRLAEDHFLNENPVQFYGDTREDKPNLKPSMFRDACISIDRSHTDDSSDKPVRSHHHSFGLRKEKLLSFLFPFHAFP